jgi:hypothetical protein
LPSGPRIAQLDIPQVIRRSILRAEDNTILIGGEPQGRVSFVAVIAPEIARTESGIHVSSTRDEITKALGPPVDDPERVHDPRLLVPTGLRNARFVMDGDRSTAIVVVAGESDQRTPVTRDAGVPDICPRPTPDPDKSHAFGACLTASGNLVQYDADSILVAGEGDKPLAAHVPGLVFAAPLRNPLDSKDEVVAIARADESSSKTWSLYVFRIEAGRLVRVGEPAALYTLTSSNARWIGADLHELDLLVEVTSHPDSIEVGGLLTSTISASGKLRDIATVLPTVVPRRRAKSAPSEATDAGTSDAAPVNETGSERHARP